jgi:hypothetical protein
MDRLESGQDMGDAALAFVHAWTTPTEPRPTTDRRLTHGDVSQCVRAWLLLGRAQETNLAPRGLFGRIMLGACWQSAHA